MHNMMVEEALHDKNEVENEVESATVYITLAAIELQTGNTNTVDGDDNDSMDWKQRWTQTLLITSTSIKWLKRDDPLFYDRDSAEKLKNTMMRHLHKQTFGHDAMRAEEDLWDS